MVSKLTGVLFIILLATSAFTACKRSEGEIFLIPDGYIGIVAVFFNVPDGKPVKYSKERYRIYEIDTSGILKTQFDENDGVISTDRMKYYYVKDGKVARELHFNYDIPYEDSIIVADDSLMVFSKQYGGGIGNKTGVEINGISILVGYVKDADSLFLKRQHIFLPDLIEN